MNMEFQILDWIQSLRTPWGDVVMPWISALGNAGMIWMVLAAALLLLPKTRKSGVTAGYLGYLLEEKGRQKERN